MELHEITRHIIALQPTPGTSTNAVADWLEIPLPRQSYCHSVLEFETCLDKWEKRRLSNVSCGESSSARTEELSVHLW